MMIQGRTSRTTQDLPETISIIGAGRLGIPIAACLAAKGFTVVCADTNPQRVDAINAGTPPIYETDLQDMLDRARPRLSATTDTAAAVHQTEVSFIFVPTPSEPGGGFSLQYVLPACEEIGQAMTSKDQYHLVVLVSTVMPGSTGGPVCRVLEQNSGKRCSQGFGLCYSPEFVALGSVIHDYLHPDFILIGQSDPQSGERLASIYDEVCETKPPKTHMNFINAELAKIAVNSFITTKITFANALAGICQNLPGADIDQVTGALGMDSRIGHKYLKGGLGYGGPCFPRDNQALASVARSVQTSGELPQAVDRVNRHQVTRLANLVKTNLEPGASVGILGMAYKPNSDVVEQSQGLLLAETLMEEGIPVVAYDPAAMDHARDELDQGIRFTDNPQQCIDASGVVVIATPWREFADLTPKAFGCTETHRVVIDPWRLLIQQPFGSEVRYIPGGIGMTTGITVKPQSMATHTPYLNDQHTLGNTRRVG